MSEEAEIQSLSSSDDSYDSYENPPLPDEPIPETFLTLNVENSSIHKDISAETKQHFELTSSSVQNSVESVQLDKSNIEDDGWNAILDPKTKSYYFWNSKTNETTWKNPRFNR
ncbi:hypothetical protein PCK2_000039 [Pneumocystis canis]|nr:hypothetical protein PCK2_000039 [Pneumocystis canis]